MRTATLTRKTNETDIRLTLRLDGQGDARIESGIGFFDHMLGALTRHSLMDLELTCAGDLQVDSHHTVEDCGIVLGQALKEAIGDKRGITRTAHSFVPMDEALGFCALDLSGRGHLEFSVPVTAPMIGEYDAQMTQEFFRAVSINAGITAHIQCTGQNAHHMAEAVYKAFGRALRQAASIDPRVNGVPSTKGTLG